jgi:hypothetical protein
MILLNFVRVGFEEDCWVGHLALRTSSGISMVDLWRFGGVCSSNLDGVAATIFSGGDIEEDCLAGVAGRSLGSCYEEAESSWWGRKNIQSVIGNIKSAKTRLFSVFTVGMIMS